MLLEVRQDAGLGRLLPHTAVGLEEAHIAVIVQPQQKLALRLIHLQESAIGPQCHTRLDRRHRLQGDALPGLHRLGNAVVAGGHAILLADAGEQVQHVVYAGAGGELAPQLDDGLLILPEAITEAGDIALRNIEAVSAHHVIVGREHNDPVGAVHTDEDRQVGKHVHFIADQLHDAVQARDGDAGGPVDVRLDANQVPVRVGVAVDVIGLVFLEGHKILGKFFQHR